MGNKKINEIAEGVAIHMQELLRLASSQTFAHVSLCRFLRDGRPWFVVVWQGARSSRHLRRPKLVPCQIQMHPQPSQSMHRDGALDNKVRFRHMRSILCRFRLEIGRVDGLGLCKWHSTSCSTTKGKFGNHGQQKMHRSNSFFYWCFTNMSHVFGSLYKA